MWKAFVVLAIVVGLAGVSAQAQQITSDIFYSEMFQGSITASLGAVGGAVGSAGVGGVISFFTNSLQPLGWGWTLGLIAGVPLGATFGVASVGSANGIEGNPWLALVGALAGESVAVTTLFLATRYTSQLPNSVWIVITVGTPVAAALGAALGYNWGAKVKTKLQSMSSSSFKLASVTLKW
ncbi:hypothetical protein HY230_06185 [Candidatus Acetothermia bacterium]|nr:hypothetical protein [Candidatus Acetothermia bacterium]MBI3660045.1 hypothetical protein [Candidatus Acetothermia bacterium]